MSKVIETDCYVNKCECGEFCTMRRYQGFKEGTDEVEHGIYLSFCKCGNIYVAKLDDGPTIPPRTD